MTAATDINFGEVPGFRSMGIDMSTLGAMAAGPYTARFPRRQSRSDANQSEEAGSEAPFTAEMQASDEAASLPPAYAEQAYQTAESTDDPDQQVSAPASTGGYKHRPEAASLAADKPGRGRKLGKAAGESVIDWVADNKKPIALVAGGAVLAVGGFFAGSGAGSNGGPVVSEAQHSGQVLAENQFGTASRVLPEELVLNDQAAVYSTPGLEAGSRVHPVGKGDVMIVEGVIQTPTSGVVEVMNRRKAQLAHAPQLDTQEITSETLFVRTTGQPKGAVQENPIAGASEGLTAHLKTDGTFHVDGSDVRTAYDPLIADAAGFYGYKGELANQNNLKK